MMTQTMNKIICSDFSEEDLIKFCKSLYTEGFSKDYLYNLLESSRYKVSEDKEDVILDVMDYVCGWCNPNMEIIAA